MLEIDATIKDLIQNDRIDFEPNPAIKIRLKNHLQMKIGSSVLKQNSMLPFFTGFLSTKLIGFKVGVITALIIGIVGLRQFNNQSGKIITTDTCFVNEKTDSIGYLKVMDSTSFN